MSLHGMFGLMHCESGKSGLQGVSTTESPAQFDKDKQTMLAMPGATTCISHITVRYVPCQTPEDIPDQTALQPLH